MLNITFEIRGGGYDPMANPMPKIKYTKRQVWLQRVQNYVEWKKHVQVGFLDALKAQNPALGKISEQRLAKGEKPLDTGNDRMEMNIHIFWSGERHADSENVFGSIADSIFQNDKRLTGKFDYTDQPKTAEPYVVVEIKPYPQTIKKK